MEWVKRHTKKYGFKAPNVERLKELATFVQDPSDFRKSHGKLLPILNTHVDEGLLKTLVQFYDPVYRCFTFPDYQLVPTLEEYANLLGIPVSDKIPFNGLEAIPKSHIIAASIHMKKSEVESNWTTKGNLPGLTSKFLIKKAFDFIETGSMIAFEAVLALLIYGLVLFPNVKDFVDINAIKIFLIGNPVPTLLGDMYFSVHHRNRQGGGIIVCCAPLLFKWIVSHLPESPIFTENREGLRWPRRLMSLTNTDIRWYTLARCGTETIDSCGEFANVPLIGTQGGINYNPILARRQLGYANSVKPVGLTVESYFYQEREDPQRLKTRMMRAWYDVRWKEKGEERNCIAMEAYTCWVKKRAKEFQMPYDYEKPMSLVVPQLPNIPIPTMKEYQDTLAKMRLEKNAWEHKFRRTDMENRRLKKQVKDHEETLYCQDGWLMSKDEKIRQKDAAIKRYIKESKKNLEASTSNAPMPGKWKNVVDKLRAEKAELKAYYGKEIMKLKLHNAFGSSSDEDA